MYVEPYAQRKAELVSVIQPERHAVLEFPARLSSKSFAARVMLPRFFADLILHDDRKMRPVHDEFNHVVEVEPLQRQHQWRVRTVPDPVEPPTYAAARDRAFILDLVHPYLLDELEQIIRCAGKKEQYAPRSLPDHSLAPRYKLPKHRTWRSSHGWMPHSDLSRRDLTEALRHGAETLANAVWNDIKAQYRATGCLAPADYSDIRVEWEWRRMTQSPTVAGNEDCLTLDDVPADE